MKIVPTLAGHRPVCVCRRDNDIFSRPESEPLFSLGSRSAVFRSCTFRFLITSLRLAEATRKKNSVEIRQLATCRKGRRSEIDEKPNGPLCLDCTSFRSTEPLLSLSFLYFTGKKKRKGIWSLSCNRCYLLGGIGEINPLLR